MQHYHLSIGVKSLLYASKTLIGGLICWYGLIALHVANPIWAVITVMIVSDPDLNTTRNLATVRVVNTLVGCAIGLGSMLLFGYSPLGSILTAAATVLLITSIPDYPTNWRLAPVTVIILMDAGRLAHSSAEAIHLAVLRGGEIIVGCAVALTLALLYTRFVTRPTKVEHGGD